jgi:hypothetical protein
MHLLRVVALSALAYTHVLGVMIGLLARDALYAALHKPRMPHIFEGDALFTIGQQGLYPYVSEVQQQPADISWYLRISSGILTLGCAQCANDKTCNSTVLRSSERDYWLQRAQGQLRWLPG